MMAPLQQSAAEVLPLELVNIGFSAAGTELLRDINLVFDVGPTTVILGPNGAGKTLLLRICHGLLTPSTGTVRWHNPSLANQPASQGMVFQYPILLRRSVVDNVRFALNVCSINRSHHDERITESLRAAGLLSLANRRALHLSGGEQQLLALARCLAVQHRVLFLDEPTAHLDPTATRRVEKMIGLIREAGSRVIMVTHDTGQARRLADQVIFMHQGTIRENGPAAAFFAKPASREAAAYLAGELLP